MIRILGKRKVAKRIFWGLAIVVIPSFLIWGVGSSVRGAHETLAAKVNREAITRDAYFSQLQEILNQYRQFYKTEPVETSPEMEKIKKAAVEGLIKQTLLAQETRRRHIKVTDQEILAAVKQDPSFKDDKGNFDERKFREIVASVPEEELMKTEDNLRRNLTLRKLQNLVVTEEQVKITDQDITDYREKYSLKPDVKDDILRRFIMSQKAGEAFENWYQQVRKQSKIEIYI